MGIIKAISNSVESVFADQWKEIITCGQMYERTAVSPGILKNGAIQNNNATPGVITNGSKIFVPENTIAFIFSQLGIEDVITTPGGYTYTQGEESILNGDGFIKSFVKPTKDRFAYAGNTSTQKYISYVNLRELRDIKFGTKGPLMYNDMYYGADLEITSYGSFSIKIVDPIKFIKNYLPPSVNYYTFDSPEARSQILSEFMQSFVDAINSLSTKYRISQLPSQSNEIAAVIVNDSENAGTWKERFGFTLVHVGIMNIEFSEQSKEFVNQYTQKKLSLSAYEDISTKASNISAQQKIAEGIKEHGFGNGPAGIIMGMNMAQAVQPNGQMGGILQSPVSPQVNQSIQPHPQTPQSPTQYNGPQSPMQFNGAQGPTPNNQPSANPYNISQQSTQYNRSQSPTPINGPQGSIHSNQQPINPYVSPQQQPVYNPQSVKNPQQVIQQPSVISNQSLNNHPKTTAEKVEEVKKLKELLDIQAITQEEFNKLKNEILGL